MKTYWFSIDDGRGMTDIEANDEKAARRAFMRSDRVLDWIEKHDAEPVVTLMTWKQVQSWSLGRMG